MDLLIHEQPDGKKLAFVCRNITHVAYDPNRDNGDGTTGELMVYMVDGDHRSIYGEAAKNFWREFAEDTCI